MGTAETGSWQQGDADAWGSTGGRRRQPGRRSAAPTQTRTYAGPRAAKGPNEKLADFLGWFSIGLGVSEIVMPRVVSKVCGVDDSDGNTALMRTLGMREVASGVGILTQDRPTTWLWARVAGDLMDLALLGKVMSNGENHRGRTTFAMANVLGVLGLDTLAAQQIAGSPNTAVNPDVEEDGIHVRKTVTVNRSPEEVYAYWHDFQNLPRFVRHLRSSCVRHVRP